MKFKEILEVKTSKKSGKFFSMTLKDFEKFDVGEKIRMIRLFGGKFLDLHQIINNKESSIRNEIIKIIDIEGLLIMMTDKDRFNREDVAMRLDKSNLEKMLKIEKDKYVIKAIEGRLKNL